MSNGEQMPHEIKLPPLPEAGFQCGDLSNGEEAYTAQQMQEHARAAILADRASTPAVGAERLHKFLNAAAGEGLVLDGVDAANLYIELFPERYAAAISGLDSAAPPAPAEPDYAALELEHLGDPAKQSGIYAQPALVVQAEPNPADLKIEAYPPRPTGGMVVGMPKGVRITHIPTGHSVAVDSERSQHRNRDIAYTMLLEKLAATPQAPLPTPPQGEDAEDAAKWQWFRDDGEGPHGDVVMARIVNQELTCEVSDYDAEASAGVAMRNERRAAYRATQAQNIRLPGVLK